MIHYTNKEEKLEDKIHKTQIKGSEKNDLILNNTKFTMFLIFTKIFNKLKIK